MKTEISRPLTGVAAQLCTLGEKKLSRSSWGILLSGFLAGAFIAFACHIATVAGTGWVLNDEAVFYGVKKLVMGAVFGVGLMLVIIGGTDLFTGNCLLPAALAEQRIGLGAMLKNWALVWVANLLGSLFIAVLIAGLSGLLDGKVGHTAVYVAAAKASLPLGQVFVRGILANWLVCMAIVMALSAQEAGGKVLAIFFPVLTFVASGFEHSVANMYFMPAGLIAQAHFGEVPTVLTVGNALRNIAGATAGNIVGGGLFVALFFVWMERSVKKKV